MTFDFAASAKEKLLVVAHRGTSGGNIPCNTLPAFEIALSEGADVLELDVEMSHDGQLFVFHPGQEPWHLCCMERIKNMTAEEVSRLRFVNMDNTYTQFGVNTFDEILEHFKRRCYINVDKFWGHPVEIYEAIKKHNMIDQIVVKSAPSDEVFRVLNEVAPELPFMPIVRERNDVHEQLLSSPLNYIGAEVLFTSDDAEVAQPSFIEKMHRDGKLVWVNAIIYNYKKQLAAGHSDDCSVCGDPENGWGWLADRGFDFIQTDWTGMMVRYLEKTGRMKR